MPDRRTVKSSSPPIEAVIFDMDGVITDTAEAHASAWKRLFDEYLKTRAEESGTEFEPFDIDDDYRAYVDGKPRYDGVKSFLESREIELPWGTPDDRPDAETICGLGNRKNRYFNDWLARNEVHTLPGALPFIKLLRSNRMPLAVFSSSRNAEAVLRSANALDLFDAKVDGNDLTELDMPGKPDPAMLLEAAKRLDARPQATVAIEDAVSGIQAAARGGFGLVVGVSRRGPQTSHGAALARNGADKVVSALSELRFDSRTLSVKTIGDIPVVWDHEPAIAATVRQGEPALFLDYDGTLTPIVEDYRRADLSDEMRASLASLAKRFPVAVISGRGLDDLRSRVGIDSVYYAGSHGFEVSGPGGFNERLGKGEAFLPDLDTAERELREKLSGIDGHAVERKTFAIAVHYRQVKESDVRRVEAAVDEIVGKHDKLRKGRGKKVFQVQPDTDWDKGHAVRWLMERLDLRPPDTLPVYVGDDITDEDAFQALSGSGIGIIVGDGTRNTSADYALSDPSDVQRFLEFLMQTERQLT